jgi:hypothetical protein
MLLARCLPAAAFARTARFSQLIEKKQVRNEIEIIIYYVTAVTLQT